MVWEPECAVPSEQSVMLFLCLIKSRERKDKQQVFVLHFSINFAPVTRDSSKYFTSERTVYAQKKEEMKE